MGVFRVNKTKNYTVMSNHHLRDKGLSLKAKGLLSQMLSLPDDWDYSVEGLVAINKESKTAIQGALKELENGFYLKRTRVHDSMGRIDYVYDIYETPQTVEPRTENPVTVNPCAGNVPQLSTDELSTDEQNTDKQSAENANAPKKKSKRETESIPPSLEEVRDYCEERHNGIDPQYFIDYYEARGWKYSKGLPVKSWKACIRTWERKSTTYDKPSKGNYTQNTRKAQSPDNDAPKSVDEYKRFLCDFYGATPEQRAELGVTE